MAKAKKPTKKAGKPKVIQPKAREEWNRKPLVLQMRGTEEWKAWVERAAVYNRITVASLVDQAVAKFVRDSGFEEEPPKR